MYEEFDKQQLELKLIRAKEAIFKMIAQFHHANKFDDGKFYMYNYCESALEACFDVLGIEEDYIPLMDFCKMWEDNGRAMWAINCPNEPYRSFDADLYYKCFIDDWVQWQRYLEDDEDD